MKCIERGGSKGEEGGGGKRRGRKRRRRRRRQPSQYSNVMGWAFVEPRRIALFFLAYFLNEFPYTENSRKPPKRTEFWPRFFHSFAREFYIARFPLRFDFNRVQELRAIVKSLCSHGPVIEEGSFEISLRTRRDRNLNISEVTGNRRENYRLPDCSSREQF